MFSRPISTVTPVCDGLRCVHTGPPHEVRWHLQCHNLIEGFAWLGIGVPASPSVQCFGRLKGQPYGRIRHQGADLATRAPPCNPGWLVADNARFVAAHPKKRRISGVRAKKNNKNEEWDRRIGWALFGCQADRVV